MRAMRFVSFCPPLNRLVTECARNSANLYVVILVIKCGIYALYIDFLRFCLHLSSDDIHHPSRTPKEVMT